jgi:chemotaxis family two-component system response regulator Rcp1
MLTRPLTILQVEDTPSDVVLTDYALKGGEIPYLIHVVRDGLQAVAFLKRDEGFSDAPRPHMILLDLSLPRLNGHEVLRVIKSDDSLRTIPVIIFTTLDTDESQKLAYELCANSYVVKPLDLAKFTSVIQSIASYWGKTSSIMPRSNLSLT